MFRVLQILEHLRGLSSRNALFSGLQAHTWALEEFNQNYGTTHLRHRRITWFSGPWRVAGRRGAKPGWRQGWRARAPRPAPAAGPAARCAAMADERAARAVAVGGDALRAQVCQRRLTGPARPPPRLPGRCPPLSQEARRARQRQQAARGVVQGGGAPLDRVAQQHRGPSRLGVTSSASGTVRPPGPARFPPVARRSPLVATITGRAPRAAGGGAGWRRPPHAPPRARAACRSSRHRRRCPHHGVDLRLQHVGGTPWMARTPSVFCAVMAVMAVMP